MTLTVGMGLRGLVWVLSSVLERDVGCAERAVEENGQCTALCHDPPQLIISYTTSPGLSVWVCFFCVRAACWRQSGA